MRILTTTQIEEVSAAGIVDEALEKGAVGIVFNVLLHGVTYPVVMEGLMVGMVVGAGYAITRTFF